ncbi:MAG: hypothetical protein QXQ02_05295 [Halobacteria archaeon]
MPRKHMPFEYASLGPCRCGLGPNAFYVAPSGEVLHAAQIFPPFSLELSKAEERELLEEEARMLEIELALIKKRLEELKKEVKGNVER